MELAKRKSPRIPGYSYATPNYYFITICTHNKECIFGKPNALNRFGEYARDHLLKIPEIYPSIQVDKYVVMPNHVHAILVVAADAAKETDLAVVIGQYKMSVTKRIREDCPQKIVWQRSFHDHVIRSQSSYEKIWLYIEHNPAKWEDDCFYLKDPETESLREGQ